MICLCLKVPKNFICLIFLDRLWFMHRPFFCIGRFYLLYNFLCITISTQSCLVLHSFCACLFHLLNCFIIAYTCVLSNLAIITIIIIFIWEFFTSALADGFPLESEWQQVSSSLQDSSEYSSWSQECCNLDSLCSFSYF